MSWDIGFTAGITDEGVDGALASMGNRIKENTHELRTFAQGMNSVSRLMTGLAGGFGAVAVYQTLSGLADSMFFAAKREAEERRKGRLEAEATYRASMQSFQLDVAGDAGMKSAQAIQDRIDKLKQQASAAAGDPLQSFQRGEITLKEYAKAQKELEANLKQIDYWGAREIENLEKETRLRNQNARLANDRFTAELEMARLAAGGFSFEAQAAAEAEKHAKNLATIAETRKQEASVAEDQMRLEEERHTLTMQNIERERQAAEEAQAKRVAQEMALAEAQQHAADTLEATLQIERYKLDGMKDQAEEAERRLKHEQAVQRIMDMQGISASQRDRLLRLEDSNFASRGGSSVETEMARGRTRSAGTGFLNFGALSRLALGGGSTNAIVKPVVEEQKKTNTKLDQLINSVKGMAGGAVYA